MSFFFVSLYGLLLFKLYSIQISKADFYTARAESQLAGSLDAPRGSIYLSDKDGNFIPAALQKEFTEIYAVPIDIIDPAVAAVELSEIVDIPVSELTRMFNKKNDQYELLVEKASDEQIQALDEIGDMAGIYKRKNSERFYPLGKQAAHVLGFVSQNESSDSLVGRYGVERYFEDRLSGIPEKVVGDSIQKAVAGGDVYLSIDRNIQTQAEDILNRLVTKYNADGGTIIVQDPKTGRILANTNMPTFDPNEFSKYSLSSFTNQSVEGIYEPGSIFKVLTMAIGIDSGSITPETEYVDTGSVTLNGSTIRNWDLEAHGRVTMTNVLEKSLNTGTVFAEKQIGHGTFKQYLEKFRLEEKTGVSLPGEVEGNLRPLYDEKDSKDINFATASFGQGISMTPMELIRAIGVLANKGVMMRPLIEANEQPYEEGRIISEEAAKQVTEMMVSAVDKAVVAHIPGYNIAGKTGTAQVPDFKSGGYTKDVINTYVGYGPASDPQFIILVRLDKPYLAPLAGHTVVPAFKELAQFVINYYHISPDRLE